MNWKKTTLGNYLKVRKDRFKPTDEKIRNLKRIEKIDFAGNIFISEKPSNTGMILIKKGDLVISGINVEKGAMNLYEGEEDLVATIHYSSYSFDRNTLDIDFLKHFLKSKKFKELLKEQVPGGIKTEIKPKHLLPLVVDFPDSLLEQREVVKLLDNYNCQIDELNSELQTQLQYVKQLRQAYLTEAMQGLLVSNNLFIGEETGQQHLEKIIAEKAQLVKDKKLKIEKTLAPIKPEEIPFDIPENWVWCRLGKIVNRIFDGPFGSHLKTADYIERGIQVIRLGNLEEMAFKSSKEAFISEEKYSSLEQHTVFEGDIIIGSFLADGVKCTVLPKLKYVSIAKADCFTIRVNASSMSNRYIMYLLSSPIMYHGLFSLLRGMTRLRINTTQLKQLAVPLPPLSIQNKIVEKLDQLMQHCDGLEESIKASQMYNQQLLQQVLKEALEVKNH